MGSTTSKPAGTAPVVFQGETPVRFGSALVSTLQTTSESDHTRAQSLELHVQNRIAQELARLEARESEVLAGIDARINTPADDANAPGERDALKKSIDALKEKVDRLPRVRELDAGLAAAREGVLECLRGKQERSLDCWREVEGFKKEARRWEREFVVRTVGRE